MRIRLVIYHGEDSVVFYSPDMPEDSARSQLEEMINDQDLFENYDLEVIR